MERSGFEQLITRAEDALASGWLDECRDLLETVRLEHGESSRWANNCGVLAVQQSKFDDALGYFEHAFKLDSANLSAAMNLAKILSVLNRPDEAMRRLQQIVPIVRERQPDALPAVQAELDALAQLGGQVQPTPQPDLKPTLMERLNKAHIDEVGSRRVADNWLPWVRHDGLIFHTLSIEHLQSHRPDYDHAQLMELGWKQNIRDIEYRYRAATRPNPPHLIHPLGPGQTVVELGAYLGHYTLSAARAVGQTGRVLAVEFIPDNFLVLNENLRRNFPKTATAVHCGIWSEPGSKQAYRQSLQANSFVPETLTGGYHGVEVPTESVDSLLKSHGIETVDLLIITINGAELEAFKGMQKSMPRIKAMAIAARYGEPGEDRVRTVCEWLSQSGYETSVVGGDHVYGRRA